MVEPVKFETKNEAAKYVALYIANSINLFQPAENKPYVLGLPTGSSPEPVYAELINLYEKRLVSFENVVTFNMDEYCEIEPTNDQSYDYFMHKNFFDHVDLQPQNINILNSLAEDYEKECADYEAKINKYGKFNLFMGGLGPKGHIAFNESGSPRDSKTRVVNLDESTIIANSRFFGNDTSKVPTKALSVGISTIIDNSNELLFLVFGETKREILHKTLTSEICSGIPSTYLREHKNCMVVFDSEAAGN